MLLRRISYVFSAVLLIAVVATAFANREAEKSRAVAPPLTTAGPPPPTVRGELPGDAVIRARTGDIVSIAVRSDEPDEAIVDALGLRVETSEDTPGVLDFVAGAPGRYPVQLLDSATTAGTIVIEPSR